MEILESYLTVLNKEIMIIGTEYRENIMLFNIKYTTTCYLVKFYDLYKEFKTTY